MKPMGKKGHLVESIKQTVGRPQTQIKRTPSQIQSYESFANTAIDYSKNPFNDQRDDYNQNTGTFNCHDDIPIPDENDEACYDPDIMNQIQMEIYKSNTQEQKKGFNQKSIQNHRTPQKQNDTESELDIPIKKKTEIQPRKPQIQPKKSSLKPYENQQNGESASRVKNNPVVQGQIKRVRFQGQTSEQHKIVLESDQSSLSIPKKVIKPAVQSMHEEPLSSQPAKKLKQDHTSEPQKIRQVQFKVNIKLLNSGQKVKKVIKCLENDTKNREDAKFLVDVEGKRQKIIGNTEMIYFYKDSLIDYYQGIHFS